MPDERDPYRWIPDHRLLNDYLDRHLVRIGADRAALTDPLASMQVTILRHTLSVLESALADERVSADVGRRVIERVVYGCVPNPVDADERTRMSERLAERMAMPPESILRMTGNDWGPTP